MTYHRSTALKLFVTESCQVLPLIFRAIIEIRMFHFPRVLQTRNAPVIILL